MVRGVSLTSEQVSLAKRLNIPLVTYVGFIEHSHEEYWLELCDEYSEWLDNGWGTASRIRKFPNVYGWTIPCR